MTILSTRTALAATILYALAAPAAAQVVTDRAASILIYPKVVADGSSDSIVQMANLSHNVVSALCHYVEGGTWQATAFTVDLQPMQPLHWVASRGRVSGENDIPAAPAEFRGELLCVQIDQSGAAFSGNQLVGGALTLIDVAGGDVAAYAAVGLTGLGLNDGDDVLCAGGDVTDGCFLGAEYEACPAAWLISHPSEGAENSQLGAPVQFATRLSVVPCGQNLRDRQPATVNVAVSVTNEFEQTFSGALAVTCWADLSLADVDGDLFDRARLGSDVVQTRLSAADGSGAFVVIAEVGSRAGATGPVASVSAINAHQQGAALATDVITLPVERP